MVYNIILIQFFILLAFVNLSLLLQDLSLLKIGFYYIASIVLDCLKHQVFMHFTI